VLGPLPARGRPKPSLRNQFPATARRYRASQELFERARRVASGWDRTGGCGAHHRLQRGCRARWTARIRQFISVEHHAEIGARDAAYPGHGFIHSVDVGGHTGVSGFKHDDRAGALRMRGEFGKNVRGHGIHLLAGGPGNSFATRDAQTHARPEAPAKSSMRLNAAMDRRRTSESAWRRAICCTAMRPEFTTGNTAPAALSARSMTAGSGTRSGSGMNSMPSYPHDSGGRQLLKTSGEYPHNEPKVRNIRRGRKKAE
jgi:hypothetical protein